MDMGEPQASINLTYITSGGQSDIYKCIATERTEEPVVGKVKT